jgi:hypothetical protein
MVRLFRYCSLALSIAAVSVGVQQTVFLIRVGSLMAEAKDRAVSNATWPHDLLISLLLMLRTQIVLFHYRCSRYICFQFNTSMACGRMRATSVIIAMFTETSETNMHIFKFEFNAV